MAKSGLSESWTSFRGASCRREVRLKRLSRLAENLAAEFCREFTRELVVLEHKFHRVTFAVEGVDALVKCRHEVVVRSVQDIGQDGSFQVSSQAFDQVQARTVRRQPVDTDLMTMLVEKLFNRFGVMKPAAVANHPNPLPGVGRQQCRQKVHELCSAL